MFDEATEFERVLLTVEVLTGPATVSEIAETADVSRERAEKELERLEFANRAVTDTQDEETVCSPGQIQMFFDEIRDQIESTRSREELKTGREDLRAADSLDSSHTASTRDALDTDEWIATHALHLYDDVTELGSPDE